MIADRLALDIRAEGAVTPEDLQPVPAVDGAPAIFQNVAHLMVSTGGSNPRVFASEQAFAAEMAAWAANEAATDDLPLGEAMAPAATADKTLVIASEQLFVPAIDDAEVRGFVASPRLYMATRTLDLNDPETQVITTDLMRDPIRLLPRDGAPSDAVARHQVWYGALQGAIETEYAIANAGVLAPDGLRLLSVSFDMGKPLTVVTGADPAIPAADERLAAILAGGGLAVVPGDAAVATTWWEIAADGSTRSVMAPSLGVGISSGRVPKAPRPRVEKPPAGSKPGNQQQGGKGGTEYQQGVKIAETNSTEVGKTGGRVVEDGFERTADALAKWKKFNGGS